MKKKIICILGMHRSGSSFISGCVKDLGVYIGGDDELIAGDQFNESGYNENKDLSSLGEELLVALGGNHIRPPHLESGWEKSSALDPFRAKAKTLIDTKFSGQTIWGWKDPRSSFLLPFWRQIVQPTHYIIVLRNPLEVAESLLRRNGVGIRHGTELWLLHAVSALANTAACKRKIIFFEDARESLAGLKEELMMFLYGDDDGVQPKFGALPQYVESFVHHLHDEEKVFANEDVHPFTKHIYRALREEAKSVKGSNTDGILRSFQGSLLELAETEPELIMGSSSLKNCLVPSKDVNLNRLAVLDTQVISLSQTISERDAHITSLSQTISGRDTYITSLIQTISERDAQVTGLNQIVAAQDVQIAQINHSLVERDAQVTELNQIVYVRDVQIANLSGQLSLILRSRSWRLTKPVRFLFRSIKNTGLTKQDRVQFLLFLRNLYRQLPLSFKVKYFLRRLFFRVTGWSSHIAVQQGGGTNDIIKSIHSSIPPAESQIQFAAARVSAESSLQIKPYFGVRRPHGKRRVAILTNQLLDWNDGRPRFGGGERYALELARLLRELAIEVTFFQPSFRPGASGDYYSFEVKLLSLGDSVGEFHFGVCSDFTEITLDYDHVYYHLPEYASGIVREDGLMTCHGIWFDHNNYPDSIFRTPAWFEHLYKAFLNPIGVISVDTNSIGVIRSLWPELAQKMRFIPNFYDKESYFPDASKRNPDRLSVLFPRRSQINRGSRIFAEIVSRIVHDVEIIWLGEGDPVDTQIIKDVCANDKRASFCTADFDQMPFWFQKADIVVIPTIACEGTSLACIEALACGCAVIATNVGGLPDVIHDGLNGLLVEPEPSSIANAINRLIEDAVLRKKLQQSGAETAANFELNVWRARWVELLRSYGWINDEACNKWFKQNVSDALVTHPTKPEKWIILTRNAIHGGVESIIREESRLLNAPVVVCGGHDLSETCPFDYSRADDARALEKAIEHYDVILYHWVPDWALETINRSKKISIEFVHRTDTSGSNKAIPKALVTHSAFLANYVYETYGRLCRVVEHPIALDRFVPKRDIGNCVGAITSYYETKGIDIFLRSWVLLKQEFGHLPVRFYGAGEDLHKFRKLAAELNIEADFREATSEPWEAMREFRCFVVPSRLEGLPVAILEALAMDVPVVASALPGMLEFNELALKRGYDSYIDVALSENPQDLARVIRDVLNREQRKNSNAYIRDYYSPQKHCADLVGVLREECRR